MARGQALAQEHRCVLCHGADLSGGQQVPRIAQQREDYLQLTLHEFKPGKRPGYTQAMGEAVGRVPRRRRPWTPSPTYARRWPPP